MTSEVPFLSLVFQCLSLETAVASMVKGCKSHKVLKLILAYALRKCLFGAFSHCATHKFSFCLLSLMRFASSGGLRFATLSMVDITKNMV